MKVLLLEDNKELNIVTTELLKSLEITKIISIHSYNELILQELNFDVAILDVFLGDVKSGLDAFLWLQQQGFKGKTIYYSGGDISDPLKATLILPNVFYLEMPARIEEFEKVLGLDTVAQVN